MPSYGRFARYCLIAFSIGAVFVALWHISPVLLLGFGGVVLAIAIRAGGDALARYLPIGGQVGTAIFVIVLAVAIGFGFVLLGDEMAGQLSELRERIPQAIARARQALLGSELGRIVLSLATGTALDGLSASGAVRAASATFGVVSDAIVVTLIALYLSFSPKSYLESTIEVMPPGWRADVRTLLHSSGSSLRRWLLGQLVAMLFVGTLTAIGLWLVGVPSPIMLGIIAGLLEFVPFIGPFLAAVPGVLFAFSVGPGTALYAAVVYLAVQQLEGALILPLAQKWAVQLPPALGLIAIVIFGVLFGIPGILLATPLTVVLIVLVKHFHPEQQEESKPEAEATTLPDAERIARP